MISYILDKKNRSNIKSRKVGENKFTIEVANDIIFIEKMNEIGNEINHHTIYYIAKYGCDNTIKYDLHWVNPSIKYFEKLEEYEICHLILKKFSNQLEEYNLLETIK